MRRCGRYRPGRGSCGDDLVALVEADGHLAVPAPVEHLAARRQGQVERGGHRFLERPGHAVLAVAAEPPGDVPELGPGPRVFGRRDAYVRLLQPGGVGDEHPGLLEERDAVDAVPEGRRVPTALRDMRLEAGGEQVSEVGEVAAVGEVREVVGGVVDDVGASPPSKEVRSWSWTLSQLPCTYSTLMSGWVAFHSFTSSLLAVTDSSCQARDWKRRVIRPGAEVLPPPVQPVRSRVRARARIQRVRISSSPPRSTCRR